MDSTDIGNDLLLARDLRSRGWQDPELARQVRQGELFRIRRGAYSTSIGAEATAEDTHRSLVWATVPLLREGAVLSHASAALVHGLPVWAENLGRVHITRSRNYGGIKRSLVHVHDAPLQAEDVTEVNGLLVTDLTRTVLDLGRQLPFAQAVAAGDRALGLGLTRDEMQDRLLTMRRWPGVRQARRVVAFVDQRSESPGESVSRVRLVEQGLPAPIPQLEVVTSDGDFVARCDFGWEDRRTVGEFDGKVKYGRLLQPGQSVEDIVYAEKLREDALRDLGWQVVRWCWSDLSRPGVLRARVQRAFARSA